MYFETFVSTDTNIEKNQLVIHKRWLKKRKRRKVCSVEF